MVKARVLSAVGIVAVVGRIAGVMSAQTPASPAFDVASVKANESGTGRFMIEAQPGGRFVASNVTLQMLILDAYRPLQNFQLSGAPSWLGVDRFDVVAKTGIDIMDAFTAERRPGPSQLQLMIRTLLADRFKLTVHTERRELPVYALVMARNDGRMGPTLVLSSVDCAAASAAGGRRDTPPPGPSSPSKPPPCSMGLGLGHFWARSVTLFQFASECARLVNRPVLDRTGLTGLFDVDLTWTPDQMPQRPPDAADPPPPIDPNGPSIFTAVQEQLGLKLESTKGPVDVLVIDSVEQPTAD